MPGVVTTGVKHPGTVLQLGQDSFACEAFSLVEVEVFVVFLVFVAVDKQSH